MPCGPNSWDSVLVEVHQGRLGRAVVDGGGADVVDEDVESAVLLGRSPDQLRGPSEVDRSIATGLTPLTGFVLGDRRAGGRAGRHLRVPFEVA
jgi:hypothetical protein